MINEYSWVRVPQRTLQPLLVVPLGGPVGGQSRGDPDPDCWGSREVRTQVQALAAGLPVCPTLSPRKLTSSSIFSDLCKMLATNLVYRTENTRLAILLEQHPRPPLATPPPPSIPGCHLSLGNQGVQVRGIFVL